MPVVRYEQVDQIGHIVLCDPPENQLGRQWADDLRAAVREASSAATRVLLIRAEGLNFGTGGDVAEWPDRDIHWFQTFIDEVNQAYRAIEAMRIPTIAAVRGKAVGGHFELVLHCDLIIAAETATLHALETLTAMVPLAGGLQRLAERVGRGRAAGLVLEAQPIDGIEAAHIGLANHVVPEGEVEGLAADLAERLASGATLAYGSAKALLKAWSSGGVAGADELLLDLSMRLFETEDAQRSFKLLQQATAGGKGKSDGETGAGIAFAGR